MGTKVTTRIKPGDLVSHHIHGEGVVASVSPNGEYMTVKYPTTTNGAGNYIRTHSLSQLTHTSK